MNDTDFPRPRSVLMSTNITAGAQHGYTATSLTNGVTYYFDKD